MKLSGNNILSEFQNSCKNLNPTYSYKFMSRCFKEENLESETPRTEKIYELKKQEQNKISDVKQTG